MGRILAVSALALILVAGAVFTLRDPGRLPVDCEWLAGDLDVRTNLSLPDDGLIAQGMLASGALTLEEQAFLARERGLDFVAITDHMDTRAQQDSAFGSHDLIWIPAYEHEFAAPAHLFAARGVARAGPTLADVESAADELRRGGGAVQIARPDDGTWRDAYGTGFVPDAIQVWIAGPWAYEPYDVPKDGATALGFFDSFLDEGARVTATGGSRSASRDTASLAGPGQPTTWVCAEERSDQAVIAALVAGRTSISHEPPATAVPTAFGGVEPEWGHPPPDVRAPFAWLEADTHDDGIFETLVGDEIGPDARIRVGVTGAPLALLRMVMDGGTIVAQETIAGPRWTYELAVPQRATWVRAEVVAAEIPEGCPAADARPGDRADYCDNQIGILALTSPLYITHE